MAEKDMVIETEEKEPVSRTLSSARLTKIWQKAFTIMSRPVFHQNQTVICISDMPSLFF